MYTNFNFSQTLGKGIAFLLLSLLAVMSISLANSAPQMNNSIEITFPNLVHLSDHRLARKGEVLVLGTNCAEVIGLPQLKEIQNKDPINMSWMEPEMTLHFYHITGNTPIDEMVQQINNLDLDCVASPNYLTYLSGHSMWGSPHDGYGANANIPDIQAQPALSMVNPSANATGAGVTVAMFDSYCPGTSQDHLQDSGFGNIDYLGDYATHVPAQFSSPGRPSNVCGHGEGVASLLRTIAPGTDIQLYRVLGDNGFGTLDGLLEAINDFAREQPPTKYVMNLSLGVMGNSPVLESILKEVNEQGTVIVAAAGNFGPDHTTQYPAAYPFVMAVAASNSDGEPTSYANPGDVLAPGGDGDCHNGYQSHDCLAVLNSQAEIMNNGDCHNGLYDCLPAFDSPPETSGASYWKGSSFSAGIVSGLAALLLQAGNPNEMLGPDEIKSIIEQGTDANGVINVNETLHIYYGMYP